jgi:hypothetical protein
MTELEKAIKLIEEAGGIVMMYTNPEEDEDRDAYLNQLEVEENARLAEWRSRREDMCSDFDKMLRKADFSISDIENMVHYHGMDMDDLEDYIHSHY